MERIAIKHKGLLIIPILLLFTTSLLAQNIPQFNAINPRNNKEQSLQAFLGSFSRLPLDDCMKATGTVKFKLNNKNKIETIAVAGNLPDTLVNTIKNRIKATEGHWSPNKSKATDYEKWFVIPVFVDRQSRENCAINKMVSTDLKMLTELFSDRNDIIITATSYLLYPFDLSGIH